MRKYIINYKFTLLSWILGTIFLGEYFGVLAGMFGFGVDYLINRSNIWAKEDAVLTTTKYWFIVFVPLTMLYNWLIVANTGPDINSGIIYSWVEFTQPFADVMAKYFPVIDNYTRQLEAHGDYWRVPRIRHLYAVIWFACIATAPLLFKDVNRASKAVMKEYYKFTSLKDKFNWYMRIYVPLLVVALPMTYASYIWGVHGWEKYIWSSGENAMRHGMERYLSPSIWGAVMSPFLVIYCIFLLVRLHHHSHIQPLIKFFKKGK